MGSSRRRGTYRVAREKLVLCVRARCASKSIGRGASKGLYGSRSGNFASYRSPGIDPVKDSWRIRLATTMLVAIGSNTIVLLLGS
jgi:hypothetical protein